MGFRRFFESPPPEPIPLFERPPLPIEALRELFTSLARPEAPACNHAHKDTIRFLLAQNLPVEPVLSWLRANGGYCDCKVKSEVAPNWR